MPGNIATSESSTKYQERFAHHWQIEGDKGDCFMTREENELLTKVGRGTPMGELFRQYQIPALLSKELEPGGPPKRVRLLGEDLVAFRTLSGAAGLVDEFCAHRRASLYFGRIEENGIRCVYHGFKYGLDGKCLEMPNVPPAYDFKEKVRIPGYPCVERGGIIWGYMGSSSKPPPVPDLEFLMVPEENRYLEHRDYQNCNYFQALEGGIDPSHGAFLHGPIHSVPLQDQNAVRAHGTGFSADQDVGGPFRVAFATGERTPRVEMVETDYGFTMAGRRNATESDKHLWRINHFLMPFYTMAPGAPDVPYLCHMWVPVDDEHHINWRPQWNPFRPLTEEERQSFVYEHLPSSSEHYGDIRLTACRATNYFMNWEIHKTRMFGVATIHLEDVAITESQGPIVDRTKENLTQADMANVAVRDRLMNEARALRDHGTLPAGLYNAAMYREVRGTSITLPKEVPLQEAMKK
jgi:phthalate 4,5-dioxygenase oxygenase subunit